ncbi:hypothetical protein Tco_0575018 [Tanacetum coccineum]
MVRFNGIKLCSGNELTTHRRIVTIYSLLPVLSALMTFGKENKQKRGADGNLNTSVLEVLRFELVNPVKIHLVLVGSWERIPNLNHLVTPINYRHVLTLVQESPSKAIVTTLPPPSVSTTPFVLQQTTTPIPTPTITTDALIITTTVFESDVLSAFHLRVAELEKYVSDLKKIYISAEALAALKTQVPFVVDTYLGSKVGIFQKELKKHIADLIQKYSLQQIPESSKKQTPTVDLEQESEKTPSNTTNNSESIPQETNTKQLI